MRYPKFLFLYSIVISFTMTSCGKETALCSSSDFDARLNVAISDFTTAQNAWFTDPDNMQKCETFRTAYQNYINELRDLSDCAVIQGRTEFRESLDEAEADFQDFEC